MSKKRGRLFYQQGWYQKPQFLKLQNLINENKENIKFKMPYYVFGDNSLDKYRDLNTKRVQTGGQSLHLGKYDRLFGYGITTQKMILSSNNKPLIHTFEFDEFKIYVDKEFDILFNKIKNGHDIVIPYPTQRDFRRFKSRYFVPDSDDDNDDGSNGDNNDGINGDNDGNGDGTNGAGDGNVNNNDEPIQQKPNIKHNLGTGQAKLTNKCLIYLQKKIDKLQSYSSYYAVINRVVFPIKTEYVIYILHVLMEYILCI